MRANFLECASVVVHARRSRFELVAEFGEALVTEPLHQRRRAVDEALEHHPLETQRPSVLPGPAGARVTIVRQRRRAVGQRELSHFLADLAPQLAVALLV